MKPDKFTAENILQSRADAIVLDLEDSVAPEEKQSRRKIVADKLEDEIATNVVYARFYLQFAMKKIFCHLKTPCLRGSFPKELHQRSNAACQNIENRSAKTMKTDGGCLRFGSYYYMTLIEDYPISYHCKIKFLASDAVSNVVILCLNTVRKGFLEYLAKL